MITSQDFAVIAPELVLVGGALLILLVDAFWPAVVGSIGAVATAIVTFIALIILQQANPALPPAFGVLRSDAFSNFIGFVVLFSAFLVALLSWGYLDARRLAVGEYMAGLLIASAGMILIGRSSNLMVIFIALEILSIALYMLIAYQRTEGDSAEAGLKYFILGAFASAIYVFGMTLVYGATGSMVLTADSALLHSPLGMAGLALLIVGMGFKVSIVPFHLWTPDVYQGAPAPVTAFLSSASKAAGLAALLRIVYPGLAGLDATWVRMWPLLAMLTMAVGNVIALVQEDVKRILAYSSVVHVGFILMALSGTARVGAEGVLFYLFTYAVASVGAFGVVAAMPGDEHGRVDLHYVRGLSRSHPALAALMTLFLLSLAGVPPLLGFMGKIYAFRAALAARLYLLAVFGALMAAMALYYYLRIIVRMYMEPRAEPLTFRVSQTFYPPLAVVAIIVVLLGLFPSGAFDLAVSSARAIVPLVTTTGIQF